MTCAKRLIDANAFFDKLKKLAELMRQGEIGEIDLNLLIASTPTVDAVEVVRCKNCKHMEVTPDHLRWCNAWNGINGMGDEGFCNYGERKDNGC